jgi:hypothetical protein
MPKALETCALSAGFRGFVGFGEPRWPVKVSLPVG